MQLWVEQLIAEYGDGKRILEKYRKTLDPDNLEDQFDAKQIGSMVSGLQISLEWMRTGRAPGNRRGADRKDAYKYCSLMDMDLLPYVQPEPEAIELTDERKRQLVEVLLRMSARERQCYLLHVGQGLSYAEIGKELKISKGVVHTYIKRARAKVQQGSAE